MAFSLEINNQTNCKLPRSFFEKVISETINRSKVRIFRGIKISLGIISEKEIKRINRTYRKKDETTDVLSFSDFSPKSKKKEVFCEILVCYSQIKKSAKKEILIKKEMAYVVSHGVLHCLGFRHGGRMYKIQDSVADRF